MGLFKSKDTAEETEKKMGCAFGIRCSTITLIGIAAIVLIGLALTAKGIGFI